jgi:hypothetical protein
MCKKLIALLLVFSLFVNSDLYAGKGYSSGSKSYSSGSSRSSGSFGKSYSSGSSRSSGSFGKSYSSGSSRSSGSSFKPSFSSKSSGGKSYSSGSSKSSSPSFKPSFSPKSSSGKSYSSSGSSKSSSPSPKPSFSPNGGKKYSSENNSAQNSTHEPSQSSFKPKSSNFNSELSKAAKQEESKIKYQAKTNPTPKPDFNPSKNKSYRTHDGNEHVVKSNSPHAQSVRRYVTHERYITYDNRASGFYGGYYGRPIYYNDFFSPFLMGWLFSDAINSQQRALWMYHHQNDMDQARWNAMLARDAQLQSEIDALRSQNVVVDPDYVPSQMTDPDLMYSKEFVDASYDDASAPTFFGFLNFVFWIMMIFLVFFGVYVLFFKEFKV